MNARDQGFSLLEAIVAMVLISIAGLALFSWINTSFIALGRIQSANAQAEAEMNAMQFMSTINPMKTPSGSAVAGRLKIEWQARALTEVKRNNTGSEAPGPFQVALYDTEVTIEELPDVPRHRFLLRLMGYERDAVITDPFGEIARSGKSTSGKGAAGK